MALDVVGRVFGKKHQRLSMRRESAKIATINRLSSSSGLPGMFNFAYGINWKVVNQKTLFRLVNILIKLLISLKKSITPTKQRRLRRWRTG